MVLDIPADSQASLSLALPDIHVNDQVTITQTSLSILFPRGVQPASIKLSTMITGVVISGTL
jgi:hypothetical protein